MFWTSWQPFKAALPIGEVITISFSVSMSTMRIVAYSLQIYLDFSGYSCMAIGLGRMFGFRFPENFVHPYSSRSVREFWRRWHISLSTWFRDYLYVPLGGNRMSEGRTRFNLLCVFIACGLWHGASWTFVAWGLFHGLFIALERTCFGTLIEGLPSALRHAYLILVVMFGWVLFRCDTLAQALAYAGRMVTLQDSDFRSVGEYLTADRSLVMGVGIVLCTPIVPWLRSRLEALSGVRAVLAETAWLSGLMALFFLSVASLAAGNFNPFIYFRF